MHTSLLSGFLTVAAGLLTAASAFPAADDPQVLLRRISEHYRTVTSLRAEFTQREKVATLGRVRESRGVVSLRRPGRMRWEYVEPDRRLVISDGATLWLSYPEEKTVYRLALAPEDLERTPLALLFREGGGLPEFFRVSAATALENGRVRLDLKPLRETPDLTSLALVAEANGSLAGTSIRDAFGNVTEITLQAVVEGPALEDDLFRFQPPAGVKVLTTRGQGR